MKSKGSILGKRSQRDEDNINNLGDYYSTLGQTMSGQGILKPKPKATTSASSSLNLPTVKAGINEI